MSVVNLSGNMAKTSKLQSALLNDISDVVNQILATHFTDHVYANDANGTAGIAGADIDIDDGGAQDIEANNGIFYMIGGATYYVATDAAIDISADFDGAGDTIATSGDGVMWVFVDTAGTYDGETNAAAQDYGSPVEALASYSIADNTLPISGKCPVGAVQVTEGGSGTFTWGDDSLSAETDTYYSFQGVPQVTSAMASFAAHTTTSQIAYGAATIRLGTGTVVTLTGKAGVSFAGTDAVSSGSIGAFGLYALADDTEALVTLSTDAGANLNAARETVKALAPNPLLPLLGVVYVEAKKATFTAGTSLLDSAAYKVTYDTIGPGSNQFEVGRGGSAQFTALDSLFYVSGAGRP